MTINKTPLALDKYQQYEIPQEYNAYLVTAFEISENDSEGLEWDYTTQGYKIFYSDLSRATRGNFNFNIIIAKMEFCF